MPNGPCTVGANILGSIQKQLTGMWSGLSKELRVFDVQEPLRLWRRGKAEMKGSQQSKSGHIVSDTVRP